MRFENDKEHVTRPGDKARTRKSEDGAVLLMVLLLVVLFTGMGLMAMQHTCAELRSAGAHLDKTQAGMIGEASIAMLATDLRLHWDSRCGGDTNYPVQFRREFENVTPFSAQTKLLKFSPIMDGGDTGCPTPAGQVPGIVSGSGLAETPTLTNSAVASVTLAQRKPICAPCPPEFSGGETYSWYTFTAESTAAYGADEHGLTGSESNQIVQGAAMARARLTIGPVFALDNQCRCGQ